MNTQRAWPSQHGKGALQERGVGHSGGAREWIGSRDETRKSRWFSVLYDGLPIDLCLICPLQKADVLENNREKENGGFGLV